VARCVDLRACTGNPSASIQGLEPIHNSREISADGQITAASSRNVRRPSVIDRPEKASAQQFGQFSGIDAVTLTALFQHGIPSGVTQHDFADVRLQQLAERKS
jgi:hypothetical protein